MGALTARLFDDPTFTKIQVDPTTTNARAILCYEKAGLERVKIVATQHGPVMYVLKSRPVIGRL